MSTDDKFHSYEIVKHLVKFIAIVLINICAIFFYFNNLSNTLKMFLTFYLKFLNVFLLTSITYKSKINMVTDNK